MKNFRFLDWKVYKDSKELLEIIFKIVEKLPNKIKFNLGDQLTRSTLSIVLNIAEGSGKDSDKDMNRFFDISLGSAYETLAGIDVLKDNKYISVELFNKLFDRIQNIAKQLGGFKKKLKS